MRAKEKLNSTEIKALDLGCGIGACAWFMVKEGAVVIDVGTTRVDDTSRERGWRLVGDVKFAEVSPKTSYITPVPGGVGPMTINTLLLQTVEACERSIEK